MLVVKQVLHFIEDFPLTDLDALLVAQEMLGDGLLVLEFRIGCPATVRLLLLDFLFFKD